MSTTRFYSLVLGAIAVTLTTAARAEVLWKGDFETQDLSQWSYLLNGELGGRKNIELVSDPVVQGRRAAKVTIHPDDLWSNGHNRVEMKHDGARTKEGETTFFSWYFRLAEPARVLNDIAYWETQQTYQQAMALYVSPAGTGTALGFRSNFGGGELWSGPITAGEWHRVGMQILWSQDPAIGRVSLWIDGQKVVNEAAGRTKPDGNDLFIQMGLHRNQTESFEEVLFIDHALEGTTLDSVLAAEDSGKDESGCSFGGPPRSGLPALATLAMAWLLGARRRARTRATP